jgi:hypothetical protein
VNTTTIYVSTNARPCASCGQALRCLNTCPDSSLQFRPDDVTTVTGVIRALNKAPQTHADARTGIPRVPVWSVACVFLGSVLMGFGFLMNQPVAQAVYEVIHR